MSDKPILFSGPMVRAILEDRKTVTRRVLKPIKGTTYADLVDTGRTVGIAHVMEVPREKIAPPSYAAGDTLWVREAWRSGQAYDDLKPSDMGGDEPIQYEADGAHQTWGYPAIHKIGRPRPGMFMPRWASRITLRVTGVKVERLQDITEDEARAEGVEPDQFADALGDWMPPTHVSAFAGLWTSINGPGSWEANPWVAAYTFERIKP